MEPVNTITVLVTAAAILFKPSLVLLCKQQQNGCGDLLATNQLNSMASRVESLASAVLANIHFSIGPFGAISVLYVTIYFISN